MARPRLIGPDHFGGLLLLILVGTIVTPFIHGHQAEALVGGLLGGVLLVGAMVASGLPHTAVVIAGPVAALLVAATGVGALAQEGEVEAWVYVVITVMLIGTPLLVLRRVLGHREVTLQTVAGALCAYLLVGIAFGSLYRTVDLFDHQAFSVPLKDSATYFSFVTLTTTGFGDITATSDVARSFVMLEAVIGQVLLVTLVARFVSTLGQVRERPGSPRSGDTTPPGAA